MLSRENYDGREHALIKHKILGDYLRQFARIIGTCWDTITYVDCFSGPWLSQSATYEDTSFAIALKELRLVRDTPAPNAKLRSIRCLFLEKDVNAHAKLKSFADAQSDVTVETRNAEFEESIPEIMKFIRDGGHNAFAFVFIDPCGYSGFNLSKIQPLLKHTPGEVLINFMTDPARRFVGVDTMQHRKPYRELFGENADSFCDAVASLSDPQDREDELFMTYAELLRQTGNFDYTCPAVVLFPDAERTYYHLIYATRHLRGVAVFKKAEQDAYELQEQVRSETETRKEEAKSGCRSLFAEAPAPPSHRAIMLKERYEKQAYEHILREITRRRVLLYDELWATAMSYPLVWTAEIKEWIRDWVDKCWVQVAGMKPRQRVPQLGGGITVQWIRPW